MTSDPAPGLLRFADAKPSRHIVREMAVAVLNAGFGRSMSRTQWLKQVLTPKAGRPFDIRTVEADMEAKGTFDHSRFGMAMPQCGWLDDRIMLSFSSSAPGVGVTLGASMTYGPNFPLKPSTNRAGSVYDSFQLMLLHRIRDLRKRLVLGSEDFGQFDWFLDLRNLVSESVSLIDSTLHQLYYKAKYDPLPAWKPFDDSKMKKRDSQRLKDKLEWVHKITGKDLNAREEVSAFTFVKELRNHLQHMDPPCFAFHLMEVADWLNAVQKTVRLNWKMRQAFGSPPCLPLIEVLIAPEVERQVPSPDTSGEVVGYASTRWPPPTSKERSVAQQPTKEQMEAGLRLRSQHETANPGHDVRPFSHVGDLHVICRDIDCNTGWVVRPDGSYGKYEPLTWT